MACAFGQSGKKNSPACRGHHPYLGTRDSDCDEQARAVLLGTTNSWFPITLSALSALVIPVEKISSHRLILDGWDIFEDANSIDEFKQWSRP